MTEAREFLYKVFRAKIKELRKDFIFSEQDLISVMQQITWELKKQK